MRLSNEVFMNHRYSNELCHYGVKGMRWGVRREKPSMVDLQKQAITNSRLMSRRLNTIPSQIKDRGFRYVSKNLKGLVLPQKEYGHVIHEFMTDLTYEQRNQEGTYQKNIGDYTYTAQTRPDDIPLIVDKQRIDD